MPILVDLLLLSINKSILIAGMPIDLSLYLLVSSLRQNLNVGFIVDYLEVKGLGVQLIFNKNIIKPRDNEKYIKETIDAIAILYAKRGCDCKADILTHLKTSLNWTTKIELTEIMKFLCS